MMAVVFMVLVLLADVGYSQNDMGQPMKGGDDGGGPDFPGRRLTREEAGRVDTMRGDNSTTEETKDCGTGWEYIVRACYSFVETSMSWDDALQHCMSTGGELLSISDVAERNRINDKLKTLGDKKATWWIGLRKDRSSWQWQWLDKGDFDPRITKWSRKGTYGNRYTCGEFHSNGQINDKDCDEKLPFVCERHEITPRPPDLTTQPLTTSSTTTPTPTPTTTTTTNPATTTTNPTITTTTTAMTLTTTVTETTPATTTTDSTTTTTQSTTEMAMSTTIEEKSSGTLPVFVISTTTIDDDHKDITQISTTPAATMTTTAAATTTTEATTAEVTTTEMTTEATTTASTTPTTTTATTTTTRSTTTTTEIDMFALYSGCYLFESRGRRYENKAFLYTLGASTCPEVTASRVTWPETADNVTQTMPCKNGYGDMFFYCGGTPTCWRGAPNVDECASPRFKKILNTVLTKITYTENTTEAPEPKETMELTTELAVVTSSNEVTEEDIVATSKVLQTLVASGAAAKVKDTEEVKDIVSNVVKAGSNLVSNNKTKVWTDMAEQDKIRSATSLLVAMETATVAMAQEIDEPTVIVTKDENIELELRVVNVSAAMMDEGKEAEIVYKAEDSDTQFSIPVETLSHLSKGGLAKVVFMTHYTMGDILGDAPDNDDSKIEKEVDVSASDRPAAGDGPADVAENGVKEEKIRKPAAPKLASFILSASVGGSEHRQQHRHQLVRLPQPISFTMRHLKDIPEGYHSLCSFWSISESGLGEWSQSGCRVVRSNVSQTTCECDHMTNFAVLMAPRAVELSEMHESLLRLVTIVGCIISCLCLLASWVTFTCFTTLQGERNSIHKNLVACLFIAEVLFLGGIDQTQNRLACGIIAGCLQYVFLAAFLWMMLEGVHILLMLVQVFDASRSRLPYYYATAYAPPVLIVAVSAGFYHQGYGTDMYCWLTTERHFIWSFAGPVAAILLTNTVILVYAMTMVYRHSEYVFGGKDKTTASGIRSWIQGALAMEVLLGLTWMLGFFFLDMQTVAVAYVFTVLNTLQGLFIFIFHCLLNKKTRKEYQRVMKVKRRPSTTTGSGSGTHSSSARNKLTSGPSFSKHSNYMDTPTYHYFSKKA